MNFSPPVADERPGQQMRLAEDLKAAANADDEATDFRVRSDSFHRGRESGDRAVAQVVAVGKTAGHDNAVHVAKRLSLCQM